MNNKWLIPIFGISLLIAVVLSGVLLISHPSVWNPMHEKVMAKDFKERQKLNDRTIAVVFADAEKVSGGLWNEVPYAEISSSLGYKRMNEKEIYHYEDVRGLLKTAKWVTLVALLIALVGFIKVGWRKVWNSSIASFIVLGAIAGIWMLIYWRGLFRALHWVIFQDDSWILPSKSYSLGLFPHKVWQAAGGMIAAYVLIVLVAGIIIQGFSKKELK